MRKMAAVLVVFAVSSAASANMLGSVWTTYEADWGSGTFSNMSASGCTISTDGGSNVAYQIIATVPGNEYTLVGNILTTGTSFWTEVLMFPYTGQNLAAGEGIDISVPDENIISKIYWELTGVGIER